MKPPIHPLRRTGAAALAGPTRALRRLAMLLPCLGCAWPLSAAEPDAALSAPPAQTRPALREAAMPRRTPAIVLPSVDDMRAAARAEVASSQRAAGQATPAAAAAASAAGRVAPALQPASALPAVAVPGVVLPPDDKPAVDRRRAPQRGFLPPLPLTVRPVVKPAQALPAPAAQERPAPDQAAVLEQAVSTPGAELEPTTPAAPVPAEEPGLPPAPAPTPAFEAPPPDASSPDPLERLRARLAERLSAVKPPDAASPYELQISTRAVAAEAAAKRPVKARPVAHSSAKARGVKSKALGEGEWAYDGERGPEAWGGLCATGRRQSPIDIRGGLPVALEPIQFDYRSGDFSVLDTGHTVQVNVAPGNFVHINGRRYELQQFHFHRPSEERLDGRRFDLSVHLVHRDERGGQAVVALLVQQGSAQPVLRSVFGNLPLEQRQENTARSPLNPADLLPGEQGYFTYMGSRTTPPCSEDVLWVVLRHPVTASAEQIELISRLYPNNARPLQQAQGRRILQSR